MVVLKIGGLFLKNSDHSHINIFSEFELFVIMSTAISALAGSALEVRVDQSLSRVVGSKMYTGRKTGFCL